MIAKYVFFLYHILRRFYRRTFFQCYTLFSVKGKSHSTSCWSFQLPYHHIMMVYLQKQKSGLEPAGFTLKWMFCCFSCVFIVNKYAKDANFMAFFVSYHIAPQRLFINTLFIRQMVKMSRRSYLIHFYISTRCLKLIIKIQQYYLILKQLYLYFYSFAINWLHIIQFNRDKSIRIRNLRFF